MHWRPTDDPDAWVELADPEYGEAWSFVDADLWTRKERVRSFREPTPSVTWDVRSLIGDAEIVVAAGVREALDRVRGDDPYVYALDWQHACYRFDPARARAPVDLESWLIPVLPDGDYYLFLARDFRFGWLGHPWEHSVCVFGQLIDEMAPVLTSLGARIVRRDGLATATPTADPASAACRPRWRGGGRGSRGAGGGWWARGRGGHPSGPAR